MKDTLQFIVASIVEQPEKITVDEQETDGILTLTVHVPKDEMGKVIGKEGKVIRGIRNIMKIKAIKENVKINITLEEIPQE